MVVVAGIPPEIRDEFVIKFNKAWSIPVLLPLERSKGYTDSYSAELYECLAARLKECEQSTRSHLLANTNLALLYLHKNDGSESALFQRFGAEALVVPLKWPKFAEMPLTTGNQRRQAVNGLIRKGRRVIGHTQSLLAVIAEEVTNRDNKTCLLLPRKNFGHKINKVFACVRDSALSEEEGKDKFKQKLDRVSQSLPTDHVDRRKYFTGQGRLVFKSPGKAGARHGLAPTWEDPGHDSSCVIRGRMRFGVSYDPKFHYDCDIKDGNRSFPSCHGTKSVPRGRTHVNIAPNDNIR